MLEQDIWQLSATEAARGIRENQFSSESLTRSHLARLESANPAINAVVNTTHELALAQAQTADEAIAQGSSMGALHGVPITLKQNVDLIGQPNANGLPALANLIATEDAPVVANLKAAGAVILGQTNTPEFSMRFVTDNPLHGLTLNPWDHNITCGGSSGGAAAATAAGIGTIAHGNDIGGSLRWPAHCNGLATIKSTNGRVPAYNETAPVERPFMTQTFSTQGPMARSVADVSLALEVMSKGDARDPYWVPAQLHYPNDSLPCKVAMATIPDDMECDAGVLEKLQQSSEWLKEAGYVVEEIALPNLDRVWDLWALTVLAEMRMTAEESMLAVVSDEFKSIWASYSKMQVLPDFETYLAAQAERMGHIRTWSTLLRQYPIVLAPVTTARTPGPRADVDPNLGAYHILHKQLRFTTALNTLCLPAATVSAGLLDGHPVGVQLIGARYREMRCLAAAQVIENGAQLEWQKLWLK